MSSRSSILEKENERLKTALDLAREEIDQLRCMCSVSQVLKSVSVDEGPQNDRLPSDQGPTVVLRLDLGGLAQLQASSVASQATFGSVTVGKSGS